MPVTHFVVERLNWRRVGAAFHRLPGETRVAAFDAHEQAEAFRLAEEDRARAAVNPFAGHGGLATHSHWPEHAVLDFLLDHGIDPPPPGDAGRDWKAWWEAGHPTWTADQKQAAWAPLDRARFFRVREAPRVPVAYAVVRVPWAYDDCFYQAGPEGGAVTTLYRRRERAEQEAARLAAGEREGWDADHRLDPDDRLLPGADPFDPAPKPGYGENLLDRDTAPLYEVVAVELPGGDL